MKQEWPFQNGALCGKKQNVIIIIIKSTSELPQVTRKISFIRKVKKMLPSGPSEMGVQR